MSSPIPSSVTVKSSVIVAEDVDKLTQKLEDQLHEQYAINNNSNASSLISILAALTITFIGYGYVLYHYLDSSFARNVDILFIVSCVVILVLLLLYTISINLGSGQRMEQFITFAIRMERYRKDPSLSKVYDRIYPNGYNPYNKSYCNFVQGIYNILSFAMVFCLILVVVLFFCLIKVKSYSNNIPYCCQNVIFNVIWSSTLVSMLYYKLNSFCRYLERQKEYRVKYSGLFSDKDDVFYKNIFGCKNDGDTVEKCQTRVKCCFPFITILLAIVLFVFTCCGYKASTEFYTVMSVVIAFSAIYSVLIIINNK